MREDPGQPLARGSVSMVLVLAAECEIDIQMVTVLSLGALAYQNDG